MSLNLIQPAIQRLTETPEGLDELLARVAFDASLRTYLKSALLRVTTAQADHVAAFQAGTPAGREDLADAAVELVGALKGIASVAALKDLDDAGAWRQSAEEKESLLRDWIAGIPTETAPQPREEEIA